MTIQRSQFEPEYDKEDVMHTFQKAVRAIQLLKSHQLRLLNQDAALRQPMLHFHMVTSALSNLGSHQGRNLPKHQMLGKRAMKMTVTG